MKEIKDASKINKQLLSGQSSNFRNFSVPKTSEGGSEEGPVPTGVQDVQAAQEASGEQPQEKATKGTKCK